MASRGKPVELEELVTRVRRDADRGALEELVKRVRPRIFRLALRFLANADDADDATQEILLRIVTHLGSFRGDSSFRTWVYRVATNILLTTGKKRMERMAWTFDEFGKDLAEGLNDPTDGGLADEPLLLEEVKIGCTLGMLLCLDRPHRLAFILGEILEFEHREAAVVLEVSPATFRKRLSRARKRIVEFTQRHCGLVEPKNECRCSRRVGRAMELGRVDRDKLQFAQDAGQARNFPAALEEIRALEETRRAAALYRSQYLPEGSDRFADAVKALLQSHDRA